MAAQGYDLNRFIDPVREEYICVICSGVLNDPRRCQNGEHRFCLACITHFLQNPETQECPECREHLTPETLKHPRRVFKIFLLELKIQCDYIDRGCPDHIRLENLQHHVGNCGFAPVKCKQCDMQINRKDKDNHDKSFCQLGGANIKANQEEIKDELCQVKARQGKLKGNQYEMKENQDEMKGNQDAMKQQLNEIMSAHQENQESINRQLNKREHVQMRQEENVDEIKESQGAINVKVNQIQGTVEYIKENQDVMKQGLDEFINAGEEHQRPINRQLNKRKHDQMEQKEEQNLEEEFSRAGIKVDEMQVKIESMEGIEKTKAAIKRRYQG